MSKVQKRQLVKVTQNELVEIFLSNKGNTFSSLTYLTDEAKSRTIAGKKAIQKLVTTNATIGTDYGKKVNRIAENKQGEKIDFMPEAPKGKTYVKDGFPILTDVKSGSKHYLAFIVENHTKPEVEYFLHGVRVEKSSIWNDQYITPAGLNSKEYLAGRGSIDSEYNFHFRTVDISRIKNITLNGKTYLVI